MSKGKAIAAIALAGVVGVAIAAIAIAGHQYSQTLTHEERTEYWLMLIFCFLVYISTKLRKLE